MQNNYDNPYIGRDVIAPLPTLTPLPLQVVSIMPTYVPPPPTTDDFGGWTATTKKLANQLLQLEQSTRLTRQQKKLAKEKLQARYRAQQEANRNTGIVPPNFPPTSPPPPPKKDDNTIKKVKIKYNPIIIIEYFKQ